MNAESAHAFAQEWIAAWNAHDLERILAHYAEDVQITSPIAERLTGHAEVNGKKALRVYFTTGLAHYPELHFELEGVFVGSASLVLSYVNQDGTRAAEMMELDDNGRVIRMVAHYGSSG